MSLSYSNIFTPPQKAANPIALGSALQNKATPSPLSFSPQAFSLASSKAQPTAQPPVQPKPVAPTVQAQPGLTAAQVQSNLSNYNASHPPAQPPAASAPTLGTQGSPNLVGSYTAPEPQKQTLAQQDSQKNQTQAGLVGQGVERLQQAGEVQKQSGLLQQAMARQKQDVMGNPYYSGSVKIGQSGLIDQNQGTQLQGLNTQQQALTSQGNAFLSGASQAAPQQVPYGTQYINPLTGQSALPNGGASGAQNPQTQASTYAQEVTSGKRSYDDAVSAMGLYGNVGKQFLDQAIRGANPNFNFAQAQTLGAQQGSVGPALTFATQALSNVESALGNLGGAQKTNIPLVNAGANYVSTQLGINSDATRAMTGAVQSLRNAYASLLASAKGGTPTDYSAQASAEIPDQPTPNDIAAIRHNLDVLGQARVQTYGNPGSGQSSQSSTGFFNW